MSGNAADLKYAEELKQTAAALVQAGHGILAADESSGTVGKRVRSASPRRPNPDVVHHTLKP